MSRQIIIGWTAPHIDEQLPDIDVERAKHFERDAKAICRLFSRGVLTSAERVKAERRLVKAMSSEIKGPKRHKDQDRSQ